MRSAAIADQTIASVTAETGDRAAARRDSALRRVLVVQYAWYPAFNVAVKLAAKQCKYLREQGWEPTVLTRRWTAEGIREDEVQRLSWEPGRESLDVGGEIGVVRTEYARRDNAVLRAHQRLMRIAERGGVAAAASALPRKALSAALPAFGEYPDRYVGWVREAVTAGERAVRERGIEAVLSGCPPQSAHLVGSGIARRAGIPWLAQFGDLYGFWVGPGDWHGTPWRRTLARVSNARWMREATRVATVSPAMLAYLERSYGSRGEVVVVGFDPDEWPETPAPPVRGSRLRLLHAGSVYPGDQRPELLFDALDALLEADPGAEGDLEVTLVGSGCEDRLHAMLAGRPAARVCRVLPRVAPDEALALQRSAHALLLLNLTTPAAAGGTLSYPSKVFEYCRAERPVLAIPADPGGFVDEILARTGAGASVRDAAAAAATLRAWVDEWRRAGNLSWRGRRDVIDSFSYRAQAARLARLLDQAVAERRGAR